MADDQSEGEERKREGPWEISLLNSLLFLTIQEALKKSCMDCTKSEQTILEEMEDITNSLKKN